MLASEVADDGCGFDLDEVRTRPGAALHIGLNSVVERVRAAGGEVTIDSAVSLLPSGDGGFKLAVTLDVALPSVVDRGKAAQLVSGAHQVCPYSNATRGNIDVTLLLGGEPI